MAFVAKPVVQVSVNISIVYFESLYNCTDFMLAEFLHVKIRRVG